MNEDSRDFPDIKLDLFGDGGWIVLIFLMTLWADPSTDKEILKKALDDFQDKLEKEKGGDC